MANSPDIWNAVNGLNQQGYEAALGAVPAHQTHPGGYGNMEAVHAHMVRLPSLPSFHPGVTRGQNWLSVSSFAGLLLPALGAGF